MNKAGKAMWPLTLVNICLLRANPQDLPASTTLTLLAVAVYYVVDILTVLTATTLSAALQAAAIDTLLLAALVQSALNLRQLDERLRQTLMALAGAGALLAGVSLVVHNVIPDISSEFLWVLSVLWLFAVYGHVLRHALNVSYAAGILITGVYVIVSLFVTAPFLVSISTQP